MTGRHVSPRAMLIGIVAGAALGLGAHYLADQGEVFATNLGRINDYVAFPIGQIFLRLLFMLAVPVVFAALVVGVGELDLRSLGRIGVKALVFTVIASAIAVAIGLALVNAVGPGEGRTELQALAEARAVEKDVTKPPDKTGMELLVQMVPDNPFKAAATGDMIGLMVFALIFGVGLAQVRTPGADRLREAIQGLHDVTMHLLAWVIRLAPIGVGALLFTTFRALGLDVLEGIGAYVAVVLGALALHMFVTYPLLLVLIARRDPLAFFRSVRVPMQTAFATASSSATLPVSLETAETELRLPRRIARFVLTAGAAMNQNGTALFEGVTVLFLAQVFQVDLTLGEQGVIMAICILGGIGTAGVPGGSLPVVAMILAMFGIPPAGLALILGVDRLLDMCRTTLNVVGDLVIATCVAATEPVEAPGATIEP
jgi:dicarboxylate/amino acid:cation (Na+ or H+) symporter, DAACS family